MVCSDVKSGELAAVLAGVTTQNSQVGREAEDHLFQPRAKAESAGAGDTGGFGILCPGVFEMSPKKETPHPPGQLFQCSAILRGKFFFMLRWNICGLVQGHCSLSCHWAPLESLAPSSDTYPGDTHMYC